MNVSVPLKFAFGVGLHCVIDINRKYAVAPWSLEPRSCQGVGSGVRSTLTLSDSRCGTSIVTLSAVFMVYRETTVATLDSAGGLQKIFAYR